MTDQTNSLDSLPADMINHKSYTLPADADHEPDAVEFTACAVNMTRIIDAACDLADPDLDRPYADALDFLYYVIATLPTVEDAIIFEEIAPITRHLEKLIDQSMTGNANIDHLLRLLVADAETLTLIAALNCRIWY